MSGNTVMITHDERWFKDGIDVNVRDYKSSSVVSSADRASGS